LNQFLRMAVMAGVERAVRIHIERGDDLNARDGNGMTALMLSAVRNKAAICKLLLDAGADHRLLDPSGRTAHAIAVAEDSRETASILGAIQTQSPVALPPVVKPVVLNPSPRADRPIQESAAAIDQDAPTGFPARDTGAGEGQYDELAPSFIELEDVGNFDLSEWEPEVEAPPPEEDRSILNAVSAVQEAIARHEPIDSSAGWDDIDAYLPQQALPLPRADDPEARARLRLLLLRAIREGSVPKWDVHELSTNDDRSPNPEAEAFLSMVVNDLGADIDERFEYSVAFESFEVFVTPEETPSEEAALDEALAAIDAAATPRENPLYLYQREFQPLRLLSAEEEVELAQAMEIAVEAGIDALTAWPRGVSLTLAAGAEVKSGSRPLASMCAGDAEHDIALEAAAGQEVETTTTELEDDALEDVECDASAESGVGSREGFASALDHLASARIDADARGPVFQASRDALSALGLSRRFLLELADVQDSSEAAIRYKRAMSDYRKARDRMAVANLKLAFHLAKKYRYSGEPLDDLAQEGNVGLLKAVDRFDWRRGYKFSTYATWWIRQQIGRHIGDKGRTIRVPVHIHEKIQRLQREKQALHSVLGRDPTIDETASRMQMPAQKVAALLRIAPEPLPIHDLLVDELIAADARDAFAEPDPADIVEARELRDAAARMLSSLSTKEEQILRLRFGIGVDDDLTLDEVGRRYGLTRERIRQIETKALNKLRHPARTDSFARLALGIRPAANSMGRITGQPGNDDEDEGIEPAAESRPRRHTSTARAAPSDLGVAAEASGLARLLARAIELGVQVIDDRSGASGHIWVGMADVLDDPRRELSSSLLEFGFAFLPGIGYRL
jgi:RNA polymerase primary sigma factor